MNKARRTGMFWVVWGIVLALLVLHQDSWNWENRTLVFGFMPVGLFYHAVYSLACAGVWMMAIHFVWPRHIEEWADEFDESSHREGAE